MGSGFVSGVLIRWFWDPEVSVSLLEAHCAVAGGSRGEANGRVRRGSFPLVMS